MTEGPTTDTQRGNFWSRRSKLGKAAIIAVAAITAISIIGALSSPSSDGDNANESAAPAGEADAAVASDDTQTVTGKVAGRFKRDCLLCDSQLKPYVSTGSVWCGWRDGKVVVHVTMSNDSVEHLTVNWHPSYVIAGGGEHGAGLTAVQSDGFDAGETRELLAEQSPEGVPADSPIAECKPSFSVIESG